MGAINTATMKYEYPKMALKANTYSCPDCKKRVRPKQGPIKVHHFAHDKSDNPCTYYNHPGESQIHRDAKLALKTILEQDKNIHFMRKCKSCHHRHTHDIERRTEDSHIIIEYPFTFNNSNRAADLAYVNHNTLMYIFEICYKHKTREENRPEPWFEIDAVKLLDHINSDTFQGDTLEIQCIRDKICSKCHLKEIEEKERRRLKEIEEKERRRLKEIEDNEILRLRNEMWRQKDNEEKERQRLRKMEEEERQRLEAIEEPKRRLQREIEEKEKQRLHKIEVEHYEKILELNETIGAEMRKSIWDEHIKCSKCTYEICKKCVATLETKYNTAFNRVLEENQIIISTS
jgi:uncharacterized protein YlaI